MIATSLPSPQHQGGEESSRIKLALTKQGVDVPKYKEACNIAKRDENCRLIVAGILANNKLGTPDHLAYKILSDRLQELGIQLNNIYRAFLVSAIAYTLQTNDQV